jgi:hypothetical protein
MVRKLTCSSALAIALLFLAAPAAATPAGNGPSASYSASAIDWLSNLWATLVGDVTTNGDDLEIYGSSSPSG